MSTKYHKLLERGSGITSVVTDAQLRGLKQGPAFKRVYREMGPATEADMAEYRKNNPVERHGRPFVKVRLVPVKGFTSPNGPEFHRLKIDVFHFRFEVLCVG